MGFQPTQNLNFEWCWLPFSGHMTNYCHVSWRGHASVPKSLAQSRWLLQLSYPGCNSLSHKCLNFWFQLVCKLELQSISHCGCNLSARRFFAGFGCKHGHAVSARTVEIADVIGPKRRTKNAAESRCLAMLHLRFRLGAKAFEVCCECTDRRLSQPYYIIIIRWFDGLKESVFWTDYHRCQCFSPAARAKALAFASVQSQMADEE